MSVLFTPIHFGNLEIKNRFINSATFEGTALENGEVTDRLIKYAQWMADLGIDGLELPVRYRFQTLISGAEMSR